MIKNIFILFLIGLFSCNKIGEKNESWYRLFDGKTLTGWYVIGGNATYEVRDGTIVGTSVLNTFKYFFMF